MAVNINPEELVASAGGLDTWRLTWSSDLGGTPEFTVYINGELVATTTDTEYLLTVPAGGQFTIEIIDDGSAPEVVFTGVVVIGWRWKENAAGYRVERWTGSGWDLAASLVDDGRGWFEYQTDLLDDETAHQYRVIAEGANGDESSTPMVVTVAMARNPDVPSWSWDYDSGTGDLTIAPA